MVSVWPDVDREGRAERCFVWIVGILPLKVYEYNNGVE